MTTHYNASKSLAYVTISQISIISQW